ncbi:MULTISPECIES: hypothetical protein [unclassified Lysobacter]|uniref:helix-turn-helix domain-containing protein n=1 Tax=unclassified Lysobacter TaxID=2635362 RepID=UPI001BEA2133|nr:MULTISPECIES: hypothetical protein [unclassified Lysobacter]MBT2748385.1 hypothetical protein [Lysobacter sp. ISL-42]MBT2749848.1 hypothetical protein [Lysobacter sp. ISL-50]MBT2781176.1 hypothetical protein [Lysobacter sp. ISL-52]
MANVAVVTKEQIVRISRREAKKIIEPMKAQLVVLRKTVVALKNERVTLRREVASVSKGTVRSARPRLHAKPDETVREKPKANFRYTAARVSALRERLELSRREMGLLLGSSTNAIYTWEADQARPREAFLAKLAILNGLSKSGARQLLDEHAARAE